MGDDPRILVVMGADADIEAARLVIEAAGIRDCVVIAHGAAFDVLADYELPEHRDRLSLTGAISEILGDAPKALEARQYPKFDLRALEMPAFVRLPREERVRDWEQRERHRSRRGKRR